jgi:hypothetical protein
MKVRARKQRFAFVGDLRDDSILIGSHGDAVVQIEGNFDLSGIIYCPKYTITLTIKGDGKAVFRGKCNRIIIKRMEGNCTLDLSDVTCKELRCELLRDQAVVITGKTRVISQAHLADEAVLHIAEKPLITRSYVSGSSRIVHGSVRPNDLLE